MVGVGGRNCGGDVVTLVSGVGIFGTCGGTFETERCASGSFGCTLGSGTGRCTVGSGGCTLGSSGTFGTERCASGSCGCILGSGTGGCTLGSGFGNCTFGGVAVTGTLGSYGCALGSAGGSSRRGSCIFGTFTDSTCVGFNAL